MPINDLGEALAHGDGPSPRYHPRTPSTRGRETPCIGATPTPRALDYVAEEDGYEIGRIYHSRAVPGSNPAWFWAMNARATELGHIPARLSGMAYTKQEAANFVRASWEAAKAWSAQTGAALDMGGRLRPPDPRHDETPEA